GARRRRDAALRDEQPRLRRAREPTHSHARRPLARRCMKGLLEDLKHALRIYRRTPGASLVAVVVLAVGLAAVTAFVSLYVDLILRPHPGFERGSRLVTFSWVDGRSSGNLRLQLIERIAAESATLE